MGGSRRPSNCSGELEVDFYWIDCDPSDVQIDGAVDALMGAISGPGRVWNPWARAAVEEEFKKRLQRAARGQLRPVDEVKVIDPRPSMPDGLFEIRWKDVRVLELVEAPSAQGKLQRERKVHVRLIEWEPLADIAAVGLHVHEKEIVKGDKVATRRLQDAEIDVALSHLFENRDHVASLLGVAKIF